MKNSHQKSSIAFLMIMVVILGPCYAIIFCPNSTSIAPCICTDASNCIAIDCTNKNLTDLSMGLILNAFLTPGLSEVRKILANGNKLTKVPSQIKQFPGLTIVDLRNNLIASILNNGTTFTPTLYGTITIDLSNNQITNIPSGGFLYPNAFAVSIDLRNNQITSIAPDAFNFTPATHIFLYLSQNLITSIPSGVFPYPNALHLWIYLDSNQITSIPTNAFRFPSALSAVISLWNNKISVLPDGVFNYPSAAEFVIINLGRNKITAMPSSAMLNFPLARYIHVDFSENLIISIPCTSQFNFPRAETYVGVNLGYNKISAIPSCAFNFPNSQQLIAIDLSFNLITTISPGAFNFPSSLATHLYLSNNKISFIPPNTFSQGHYNQIYLRNNQLKRLESTVFRSVLINSNPTTVDIRGNPIDCSCDPCHLTWLLRGTNISQILTYLSANGTCSNGSGPPFSALSSFDFDNICT